MKKFTIVLLLAIIFGIAAGFVYVNRYYDDVPLKTNEVVQLVPDPSPKELAEEQQVITVSEPQTIIIPKINVSAVVESVGNDEQGKMDVPKGVFNVGWYSLGFKPGDTGSAVMAGHLDTVTGAPAVFYSISQLVLGDEVIVKDKNGKDLVFKVTKIQSYPFDAVPLQEVFASVDKPRLNLITCEGTWNTGSRNYSNRLVVFTELKS